MKFLFNYKCSLFCLLALAACSKNKNDKPVTPGGDTTVTITPQKDPTIAKSEGFFLNDWAPKTFTAPLYATTTPPSGDATVTINVDYSTVIAKVPKYLYGNNANSYMGQLVTEPDLLNSIKNLSPNILRFPGGNLSNVYFWNGIIPSDAPDSILYSNTLTPAAYWLGNNTAGWTLTLDNYYAALQRTNSTGIITVNYAYARYGTSTHPDQVAAHLAANWVRYDKGRTKYWEIGNEDYGGWEAGCQIVVSKNKDGQPAIITGALYGQHFKVFADSMRAAANEVGSTIEIGAQLDATAPAYWNTLDLTWEQGYFASAGNYADFYLVHDYFTGTDNETAATILATPATETAAVMSYMNATTAKNGVSLKPIALTEWNIGATGSQQMVSFISGMHAAMTLGELIKNQFGMASRWDLSNGWNSGNDMSLFSDGQDPDNAPKWTPRPSFYYLYYFQKYFGDRMVSSAVQNSSAVLPQNVNDIVSYASSFSSGEAGVVIVNRGLTSQIVSVNIKKFAPGNQYYYYTFTGGTDHGEFSGKVYINGNGPTYVNGGPSGYLTLKAFSSDIQSGIKISAPPRSVIFLVADGKK